MKIDQEGVFCTCFSSELEQKTSEGWQLVGVLDHETLMPSYETDAMQVTMMSGATYNPSPTTVGVTRNHVVKTPVFLLRRNTGSELGRMAVALETAILAAREADEKRQAAEKKAKDRDEIEERMKRERETAVALVSDRLSNAEAKLSASLKRWGELAEELSEANETIKKLEARLGANARPTSYERLLTQEIDNDAQPFE